MITSFDIQACRADIPALANKHYFNFGGQGTLPKVSLENIHRQYDFVQSEGPFSNKMFNWINDELAQTKKLLASQLGATANSLAITQNVTEGCNIAMWGLDWQPGDELLLTDSEHPGVVAAAQTIARRLKLTLKYFSVCQRSESEILSALTESLNERSKLVVFSHVLWNTGQTLPVEKMVELCHQSGAKSLIDGAQSAGVLNLDLSKIGADFYAITGHKWLCGPEGIGVFHVQPHVIDQLHETFVGWRGGEMFPRNNSAPNAVKFEVATAPFPLLSSLRAAVEFHGRSGNADSRYQTVLRNVKSLQEQLQATGKVQPVIEGEILSGLVSFRVPGRDHKAIVQALEDKRILVRTIPHPDCIRASVHYFTNEEDMHALVQTVLSVVN